MTVIYYSIILFYVGKRLFPKVHQILIHNNRDISSSLEVCHFLLILLRYHLTFNTIIEHINYYLYFFIYYGLPTQGAKFLYKSDTESCAF